MTPQRVHVNVCCIATAHRSTTNTYREQAEICRVREWSVSWMTKQGTVTTCNFSNGTVITITKDYRCNVSFLQFIDIEKIIVFLFLGLHFLFFNHVSVELSDWVDSGLVYKKFYLYSFPLSLVSLSFFLSSPIEGIPGITVTVYSSSDMWRCQLPTDQPAPLSIIFIFPLFYHCKFFFFSYHRVK